MQVREALTFDDVTLIPAASTVLPTETAVATKVTNEIGLGIPLLSAAMDTVTEGRLAIAMAQAGGLGIIHKNMTPEVQAQEVRRVKKFEAGMVVNPLTITPDRPVSEALRLKEEHGISGIPVVEEDSGRLVGILTNRDVRFETNPNRPIREIMTAENLITVREDVDRDEAKRLLHRHRIEKLVVVDVAYRCVGLVTVKDIERAQAFPHACKDAQGRLRAGAATGVGADGLARAEALLDAECDLIVVDTAHGHGEAVARAVADIKTLSNHAQVVAGNVATAEGARALIDAGADAIKVGIGPGSICTTRVIAGVGVPQLTAIVDAVEVARDAGVTVIADGGIKFSGDLAKAIAAGADCAMIGSLFAGTEESPGEVFLYQGPLLQVLSRHGLARRHGARLGRPLLPGRDQRPAQAGARGDRGTGAVQGAARPGDSPARRRPARGHGLYRLRDTGRDAAQLPLRAGISAAGLRESHVHDVGVMREPPNYQ